MIEVRNVSKTFNGRVRAVDKLSFDVPDGKIVGLIGPNGSGKTTMFKMIMGIYRPDKGKIFVGEHNIAIDAILAKQNLGYVSDNPEMFLRLTGLEYLNFIADMFQVSASKRQKSIAELTEIFEMGQILNDRILSYSHGMKQKIMVMGALVHQPQVWILDEPMIGLDPKSAFAMKEMMRQHAKAGKTVLFATHVLEVAEKLCDEVVIICQGHLLYQGALDDLRDRYPKISSLERIYLKLIEEGVPK